MTIGTPHLGQVIRYSFLWRNGHEKDRPAVIVVAAKQQKDGKYRVAVMPITHKSPANPAVSIEIPKRLKNHLGLDDERSWVILDEINEFLWPGYDLRPVSNKTGKWEYGQMPSGFFDKITKRMIELLQMHKIKLTKRYQEDEE